MAWRVVVRDRVAAHADDRRCRRRAGHPLPLSGANPGGVVFFILVLSFYFCFWYFGSV